MLKFIHPTGFVRCTLALTVLFGASAIAMSAQTGQTADDSASTVTQAIPALNFNVPALNTAASGAAFSSSVTENGPANAPAEEELAINATHLNFLNAMQYGGGHAYSRPRYRGGNTNQDGSNKWIFFAGAGWTQPLGDTYHLLTPSYGLQFGGGRQFSKHFAIPIQFDWDNFGFTRQNISNQSCLYTYTPASGTTPASCDYNAADNGIDANSHVWSFSVDPTYTFYQGDGLGAYVVAGVGFYHKVANFTAPQVGTECYYVCEEVGYQAIFDHYTSNAPGFNGGFGLTYKFSHFSNERFYGEVRYVFVDNSQRYGYTVANVATTSYNGSDFYPANSNRTTYIPVKFGIRF